MPCVCCGSNSCGSDICSRCEEQEYNSQADNYDAEAQAWSHLDYIRDKHKISDKKIEVMIKLGIISHPLGILDLEEYKE